jgi:hypothetical protein
MLSKKICYRCRNNLGWGVETENEGKWLCTYGGTIVDPGEWIDEEDDPPKVCPHLFEQSVYAGMMKGETDASNAT